MSGDIGSQLLVLVPAIVFVVVLVRWLGGMEARAAAKWAGVAEAAGFVVEVGGGFSEEELGVLGGLAFGCEGKRDLLVVGPGAGGGGGLAIEAVQLARRDRGGRREVFFRYQSSAGRTSVKEFGMGVLVAGVGGGFGWQLGRSGVVRVAGADGERVKQALEGIDWTLLCGHADGGRLAGVEGGGGWIVVWVTAPRAGSAAVVLGLAEDVLRRLAGERRGLRISATGR